jgi:hypothetical protein
MPRAVPGVAQFRMIRSAGKSRNPLLQRPDCGSVASDTVLGAAPTAVNQFTHIAAI